MVEEARLSQVIDPALLLVKPRYDTLGGVLRWAVDHLTTRQKRFGQQLGGHLIGYGIIAVDRQLEPGGKTKAGKFSHAGLTVGGKFRDAAKKPTGAISEWELLDLISGKCRDADAYTYQGDPKAVPAVFEAATPAIAGPDPNTFAMHGLLRIGLIMLTTRSTFGKTAFGRWLVSWASRGDPTGTFCTELVAKAFMRAGVPLQVTLHPGRVIPFDRKSVRVWRRVVENRLAAEGPNAQVNEASIDEGLRQLEALSLSLRTDEPVDRYVGKEEGEFPPYLVTPSDLMTSKSLVMRESVKRIRACKGYLPPFPENTE